MAAHRTSAGLLMYRRVQGRVEVFVAHPGGPFFRHKDHGHWSIPKGELQGDESLLEAARREFEEETGLTPLRPFLELGAIRQKHGKIVHAWAFEADLPANWSLRSNTFELEWPPGSGRTQAFPELDRAGFFQLAEARVLLKDSQRPFLDRLLTRLGTPGSAEM